MILNATGLVSMTGKQAALKECSIVIVNYNSTEYVSKLLDSIFTYYLIDVYLVDNNSTDNSAEQLQTYILNKKLPNTVHLLKSSQNKGFAAGCNMGIIKALEQPSCQQVWILNPDTIITENSLEAMIDSTSDKIGIVGSKIVYMHDKKSIQALGGELNHFFATTKHIIDPQELHKLDYIVGASMLISRGCIETIGLLPEEYFLYSEDVDYCLKVKEAGLELKVALDSIVHHDEGGTTGAGGDSRQRSEFIDLLQISNRKILARKYFKTTVGVYIGIFLTALNRWKRGQWKRGFSLLQLLFKD